VTTVVDGHVCMVGGRSNPQPPPTDPVWGGHTDGAIYDCIVPLFGIPGGGAPSFTVQFWAAAAPAPPPDPEDLAREALAAMNLSAIRIGVAPEPGAVGLVGVPNWMWVVQPDEQTYGPITRSASAAGFTVTATARVDHITWDMGDGRPVVCSGPGTPYSSSYGMSPSPDCGHTYTRQGRYTVEATSHWVVTWAGIGEVGTITMDLSQTAPVTIGEAQVLTQ